MALPWSEVNTADSQHVAQLIGLPKAERSEARKWGCPACGSSDGLHAYPGPRGGFGCWAACGAAQPKLCRGYTNLDVAMRHWGVGVAEACTRLAGRLGIVFEDDGNGWRSRPARPARAPAWPVDRSSRQELNLAKVQAIPGALLPAAVYADVVARLALTRRGTAYLARGRRLDPAAAAAYGYRSLDGPSDWTSLARHLAADFSADELAAAGFPCDARTRLVLPFNGRFPALLIPYWRAGELVGIRFRNLLRDRPEYKHNRYRTLKDAKPLWPYAADALSASTVHVVEGELNAETLRQLGLAAIGLYGAGIWLDHWTAELAGASRIVAWFDCRDPQRAGDLGAAALRARLAGAYGEAWAAARWRRMITELDPNALHQRNRLRRIVDSAAWESSRLEDVHTPREQPRHQSAGSNTNHSSRIAQTRANGLRSALASSPARTGGT